jgi:rhodanese-related sulfurtransferase
VFDLRDEADYGYGEPLVAANVPLSRVHERAPQLLPRKSVRVVLVDADGTAAAIVAQRLRAQGYPHAVSLQGGLAAWAESGLSTQFNRLGKDWTRELSETRQTPRVSAAELARLREKGEDVVVLDTRTAEEYARGHVPGAISVPGGEILYRFADLVPDKGTLVLASCAGLPRAVLGAQTLIDAGVPQRVAVLDDGTKGWEREGWNLEQGATRSFGEASDEGRAKAREWAEQLAEGEPVPEATAAQVKAWREDDARTTYLLDVRTAAEYEAGHLPGSVHAPAGQGVTVPPRFVAVRGARLVLLDNDGARATQAGHWLRLRGYEVWRQALPSQVASPERAAEALAGA